MKANQTNYSVDFKNYRLIINQERAIDLFTILEEYWRQKKGIFSNVLLTQFRHPVSTNPEEGANWFFFCALPMRGGVNSDDIFVWMAKLRSKYPDLFNPRRVVETYSADMLRDCFIKVTQELIGMNRKETRGAGVLGYKMTEHPKNWIKNAQVLVKYWQGSLLKVYEGVSEFEQAFERIDYQQVKEAGLRGIRRKIFSLLTIWLQERGWVDKFPTPIPIDFHTLRVLWVTGVIDFESKTRFFSTNPRHPNDLNGRLLIRASEKLINTICLWTQKFIYKNGFDHLIINPALWVLSRNLCRRMFQNKVNNKLGIYLLDNQKVKRMPWLKPQKYINPCQRCPIEHLCDGGVPANPYYRFGYLVKIERLKDSQIVMPGILPLLPLSDLRHRSFNNNRNTGGKK